MVLVRTRVSDWTPAVQLTFHQLRQGRKLDFAAGFRMEYRLGQRVLVRSHPRG
jgi:hypothetical protein